MSHPALDALISLLNIEGALLIVGKHGPEPLPEPLHIFFFQQAEIGKYPMAEKTDARTHRKYFALMRVKEQPVLI